jgi:energy-coupling factor transporter ATP-binding protein EcfA2
VKATLEPRDPDAPARTWAVEIEHLTHEYARGAIRALDDVSLRIASGEIVGIVGQNGSGKTTLAKHLNGLLRPTRGRVLVGGRDTAGRPVQELAAQVGYVFQDPRRQLFAPTVEADLALGPRNLAVPEAEVRERVEAAIAAFGLEPVRGLHPHRIGFATRKLVAIAAVVAMRPSILVLDEPTTGQDHATARTIRDLIARLRDDGTTVVCVSHDMPLLAGVADRLVVMQGGRRIADGPPREVFAERDVMDQTGLQPPQVTEIALRLRAWTGVPPALTVPELTTTLDGLLEPGRAT